MDENRTREQAAEMRRLRARVAALEADRRAADRTASPLTAAVGPAIWRPESFAARIGADFADGTYEVVRLIPDGVNSFVDDPDQTAAIRVGHVAERGGYAGGLAVGDLVRVRFDGLGPDGTAIYHVY
ncbi:MAG: hypothetical protein GXY33_13755 [Phycisphaerae bacterium]|nr:hypothetical protein [Phycisphaerae bacterium]